MATTTEFKDAEPVEMPPGGFKYSSLENYDHPSMRELIESDARQWDAYEKIHGANVSFYVDESGVTFCKRTTPVDDTVKFFNCTTTVKKHSPIAQEIFEAMRDTDSTITAIKLFGELCGGGGPRYSSKGNLIWDHGTDSKYTQTEIFYSMKQYLIAFDLAIYRGPDSKVYLEQDALRTLCAEKGVHFAKVLHTGTLKEMLALNPTFQSTVPDQLESKVPELKEELWGDIATQAPEIIAQRFDVAEGFILRASTGERTIMKFKGPKFHEGATDAKGKSERGRYKKKGKSRAKKASSDELTEDEKATVEESKGFVNMARLITKMPDMGIGSVKDLPTMPERQKEITDVLFRDAFKDFRETHALAGRLRKAVNTAQYTEARALVTSLMTTHAEK